MALNTLETTYVNGDVIDASHVNELTLSLLQQLVGRDASGIPTPGQSLGTLAIPWGQLYANGITLNGLALDVSQITSAANRIVSGKTRPLSEAPDFLRANGASLSFQVLGATTNLVLSVNNTATTVSSDITKSGLTAAPSTNNTCTVSGSSFSNDLYIGEEGTTITISGAGSEIISRVGQYAAFETPAGEIFFGKIKSSTSLTNIFRGFYFDSSGNPIQRNNLSTSDTLTLLNIGWVFIEDNGTTVDVSYTTPIISYVSPTSPSTGDYWFDITNQVWKRYSGTSWEIIDRILVGQVVSDDTNCVASRSLDFNRNFSVYNNLEPVIFSTEIVELKNTNAVSSVYGNLISLINTNIIWNITTNLASGLSESSNTEYYLYLTEKGQAIIDDIRPYTRHDLRGRYHPYESWRCIGQIFNDNSSDISACAFAGFNSEIKEQRVILQDVKTSGTNGGSNVVGLQVRTLNNKKGPHTGIVSLLSNQFTLMSGIWAIKLKLPAYSTNSSRAFLYDVNTTANLIEGVSTYTFTSNNVQITLIAEDTLALRDTTKCEARQYASATSTFGLGNATSSGSNEIYSQVELIKIY